MPQIARRRGALPILLLVACTALAATPAAAQRLRVTVTDAATGAPAAGAMVRVENAEGNVVAGAFANSGGVVRVHVRQAGTHTVHATLAGYAAAARSVAVEETGEAELLLPMQPRPHGLDTVFVVAAVGPETGRGTFERRRAGGRGVYLDSAYLAAKRVPFLTDLLQGVPDVYMQARGHSFFPRTTRGWGCMVQLVDGLPFYGRWPAFERDLSRVLRRSRVVAIEVYREFGEVPEELRSHAWGVRRCGLIVYWTDIGYRTRAMSAPAPP